jgi:hypothetical protein
LPCESDEERNQHTTPTPTPQEDAPIQPSSPLSIQQSSQIKRDSPDHDFYNDCYSFSPLIYAFFIVVFILGMKYTIMQYSATDTSQFFTLLYFYFVILVAIIPCRRAPASRKTRIKVWTYCFISYSALLGYATMNPDLGFLLMAVSLTSVAIVIFAEWKLWRAKKGSN